MSDEPVFSRRLGLLADHIEAGYHVSREVTVNLLRRAASAERANVLESQRDLLRRTLELCMAERDTAQVKVERLLGEVKRANHLAADARAERDTAQASEARLREEVTRAVSEIKAAAEACERAARQREDTEGPEPINTGKAAAYRIAAGRLNRALASTPNPEERACTCPPSAFTGYYTPANSCPRHGSAPDPTPEPEEGREWTLARLNGDGHLTKWDVIEDEELHRAVLSDPLWEVVTVREVPAPTDTAEEDR